MRRNFYLFAALLLFGCSRSDPDQLRGKLARLQEEKANVQAERAALEKELAAYKADLEHERFRNHELKRELAELEDLRRIADIAKRLPKIEPQAGRSPRPKPAPQPSPISAAIAVATAVPVVRPVDTPKPPARVAPKPAPKAAAPVKKPTDTVAPRKPVAPVSPAKVAKATPPPKKAATAHRKPVQVAPASAKTASLPEPKTKPPTPASPKPPQPSTAGVVKTRRPAPEENTSSAPEEKAELELLNLVNRKEGKKLLLSGDVRNNTPLPAEQVVVLVQLFDRRNTVLQTVRVPVAGGGSVPAGQCAAFRSELAWDSRVRRCRFDVEGVQKTTVSRRD